jgi:rhodanese-related sulfurtransferase
VIRSRLVYSVLTALLCSCGLVVAQQASGSSSTGGAGEEPSAATEIERITVEQLMAKLVKHEQVTIIDVRGKDYDAGDSRIKGALRISPNELKSHLSEIPRDREIVTYCACSTDGGAVNSARVLLANGFKNVRALKGGWNAWRQAGGPVEPKD